MSTTRFTFASFTLLAILLLGVEVNLAGQPDARQRDCDRALYALRGAHSEQAIERAVAELGHCYGTEKGLAATAAFDRLRRSHNVGLLEQVAHVSRTETSEQALRVSLEIGQDRSASPAARVIAFNTLTRLRRPYVVPPPVDLDPEPAEQEVPPAANLPPGIVRPRWGRPCVYAIRTHALQSRLTPRERAAITAVAEGVFRNGSEHAAVREAARCAMRG